MCRLPMSRLWSDMGSRSITRTISSSSSVWLLPMRICSSQQVEKPPLFYHIVADGQVEVANSIVHGTAVSGGGDIVRFVFRVLREFEDNARFEIADGLVSDPSQLQNPAVVAGVLELQSTPREFALHQNFPNPFNPDTTIKYDLAESADVTLQIYNVLGQVVRTLVASEAQNAGRYQIRWNGMDDRGVSVSSGIYFYQISQTGSSVMCGS